MRDKDRNFSIIHEVSNLIAHASEPGKALQQVAKLLAEETNALQCAICVQEAVGGRLSLKASYGLYLDELQGFQPGHGLPGRVMEMGRTINTVVSGKAEASAADAAITRRIGSLLIVPLFANGRIIGTLSLGRKSRQIFPQHSVELVESVAVSLATFILYTSLSRQVAAESAVSLIAGQPARSLASRCECACLLHGKVIVEGITVGRALLMAQADALETGILPTPSKNIEAEKKLLDAAMASAADGLSRIQQEIGELITEADLSIFEMHQMLLEDPSLKNRILHYLNDGMRLDYALSMTLNEFTKEYQHIDDEYLHERLSDIKDVLTRIKTSADNLQVKTPAKSKSVEAKDRQPEKNLILVAHELLPSQFISSPLKSVCGIVCECGGATSHTAILAKALGIPMMGNVSGLIDKVKSGDCLLLDTRAEQCYVKPSPQLIKQYSTGLRHFRKRRSEEEDIGNPADVPLDDRPATLDGTALHLSGNVTLFSEMPYLRASGIRDVGLYRTEFMFMIRNAMPDEEEQYRVMSRLVKAADGGRVNIRALDIGGDKPLSYMNWEKELNPSLGWRGLRFLLSNEELFNTHLRAMLRASVLGNVGLMFPMVADCVDIQQARASIKVAQESLKHDGLPYKADAAIGMMLEVPSAVASLDKLLPEVDFVSIGTNDLLQYLFAVDRSNNHVNAWYRQLHPTLFRILRGISAKVAAYPKKHLSLCGELGGNLLALPILLGCGLRSLSMTSNQIPKIRDYVRKLDMAECLKLTDCVCELDSEREARLLLEKFAREHKANLL